MARADGTESGALAEDDGHARASDARLAELLRADTSAAYAALQELRARHNPSLLAYARVCTVSESAARQLAAQAFTLAARRAARGTEPGGPLRHHLLLLALRVAEQWAADERAAGLDAGLLLILNTAGPGGAVPPMRAAFRSLPYRTQGLVWYGLVEREPAERTATLLGVTPEDVTYGTGSALQSLAQACLRSRLAASDDPRCGDFRRLIEEAVRPDSPRESPDLHAHMAHCAHCTTAYEELCALRDEPRTTLADGLLPYAGTSYITQADAAREPHPEPVAPRGTWPPPRRLVMASAAFGLVLAPLLMLVLSPGGSLPQHPVSSVSSPAAPPPVTVTATVSATPASSSPSPSLTASPSPSTSPTSASPSPTRSATPSRTPRPKPSPTYRLPGAAYAQVVNVASGLCLDVRDGAMTNGTDVITVPCTSAATQRWGLDLRLGVLRSNANPYYCLDSRGRVDRSIGIWACDTVYSPYAQNVRFTVDSHGVIRPAIATDHAVTPGAGGSVSLVTATGRADQRWRAGAS